MGLYVHLSVIFACSRNDLVAEIAAHHFTKLPADAPEEARLFLADLALRTGCNPGAKGGLSTWSSTWGIIGNYTDAGQFVHALTPFWEEILADRSYDSTPWHGPGHSEHIIVFHETEQDNKAKCYEIGWDKPYEDDRQLVITHHEDLPFGWML